MKWAMELMREGLRINIANETRASGNRSTLLPAHQVEASPNCPVSPEFDSTRDLRSCRLFEGDLKKLMNVRAPQMQALTRLLNVGQYRAKGYPAPMEWAFREKLVKYAESGPDLPRRDGAEYAVWGTSLTPVSVLLRTTSNTVPKTDHEGVDGVTAIPEKKHMNSNCGCLEPVTNNPVEFTLFSTWCLPQDCKNEHENTSFTVGGSNDVKRYLNTSMTYFSFLSEIETVYQRLMLRTPLACVSRGPAKAYTPPAAKVDLVKKPVVLKAVMAQISRPEYLAKIPRYTEDSGPQNSKDLCRFPPVEWQLRSIDVKARDKMTVDEILNNSVFASKYYGDIMCSFCCNMIVTRDIVFEWRFIF